MKPKQYRLTPEQQKLVEENHNLIYSVLHRKGWSISDYYDVSAWALCMASRCFNPSRGVRFSTYAVRAIQTAVMNEMRKERRHMPKERLVSFDELFTDSDGHEANLHNIIEDIANSEENMLHNYHANDVLGSLATNDKKILKLYASGFTQVEIGQMVGLSQAQVSRRLCNIKDLLR